MWELLPGFGKYNDWEFSLVGSFCGKTEESLEHLFIHCDWSKNFWSSVTEWLDEHGFDVRYLSTFGRTFSLMH